MPMSATIKSVKFMCECFMASYDSELGGWAKVVMKQMTGGER